MTTIIVEAFKWTIWLTDHIANNVMVLIVKVKLGYILLWMAVEQLMILTNHEEEDQSGPFSPTV